MSSVHKMCFVGVYTDPEPLHTNMFTYCDVCTVYFFGELEIRGGTVQPI